MIVPVLVDTNILVYAYDRSEPVKQQRALDVLAWLVREGGGAVTTQILTEFFVAVTRGLREPLAVPDAYTRLANLVAIWRVLDMTGGIVLEAARGVRDHQMAFYDAQIWAAARSAHIPIVLSEDFNTGASIEGVRFVNPFVPEFTPGDWLA